MTNGFSQTGQPDAAQGAACPASRNRRDRLCGRMGVEIEGRLRLRGGPAGRLSGRVTDVCLSGLCMVLGSRR